MRILIFALTVTLALPYPTSDDLALLTQGGPDDFTTPAAVKSSGPGKSSKLQEGVVSADNKPGGNVTEPSTVTVVDKPTCESFAVCYSDEQCHGGRCLGTFVGKCSCTGCHNFLRCENDSNCGGLKGACNKNVKMCDCNEGYKSAGFPLYIDALIKFCNHKTCTSATADEDCFGLPCNPGRCMC